MCDIYSELVNVNNSIQYNHKYKLLGPSIPHLPLQDKSRFITLRFLLLMYIEVELLVPRYVKSILEYPANTGYSLYITTIRHPHSQSVSLASNLYGSSIHLFGHHLTHILSNK